MNINRSNFHYFIIRPSASKYVEEILSIIKRHKDMTIYQTNSYRRIRMRNLSKVVALLLDSKVSSQNKKKIFRELTPGSLVAVVRCSNREDDYFGEGKSRHKKNLQVRKLMQEIRDKYNSKISNRLSMSRNTKHVIYASDNEVQTDILLKYMGYSLGVRKFIPKSGINLGFISGHIKKITIKKVLLDKINARFFYKKGRGKAKMIEVPIAKSPHFQALKKGIRHYAEYFAKLKYKVIKYNVDPDKFFALSKNLNYLSPPYDHDYIAVMHNKNGKYVLSNGHHRSAILLHRGVKEITVAVAHD